MIQRKEAFELEEWVYNRKSVLGKIPAKLRCEEKMLENKQFGHRILGLKWIPYHDNLIFPFNIEKYKRKRNTLNGYVGRFVGLLSN